MRRRRGESKKAPSKPAFRLKLKHSSDGRELRATVYLPKRHRKTRKEWPEPVVVWVSKYSVVIDDRTYQRQATGDSWLQALLLAVEGVRLFIPPGGEQVWMTPDEIPAWIIFPRSAPISWGYEHWRKLVDHIDKEEAAINERIADRQALQRVKRMNRSLAAKFAGKHKEFQSWFNEMTNLTLRIDDPEVAKAIRRRLAEMLFALDHAVHRPLSREYPDLFED